MLSKLKSITVARLIEILESYDDNTPVSVMNSGGDYDKPLISYVQKDGEFHCLLITAKGDE